MLQLRCGAALRYRQGGETLTETTEAMLLAPNSDLLVANATFIVNILPVTNNYRLIEIKLHICSSSYLGNLKYSS